MAKPRRPWESDPELFERRLMAEGMTYDKAHARASKREGYLRHHPAELHEALADEGWE